MKFKNLALKSISFLLAVVMVVSMLPGWTVSAAAEAEVVPTAEMETKAVSSAVVELEALSTMITVTPGQLLPETCEVAESDVYGYVVGYELKKGHVLSISDTNYVFSVRQLVDGNYSTMLKQATTAGFTATEDMTVAMLIRKTDKSAVTAEELATVFIQDTLFGMTDVAGSVHRFTVEAETIDGGTATTRAAIFLPPSYSETGEPTRLIIMTNGLHGHLSDTDWNANTADDVALMKHYMEAEYAVLVVDNTARKTNSTTDLGNPQLISSYWKAYEYVQTYFNAEEMFSLHSRSQGTFAAMRIMREHPELVKCALMCGAVTSLQSRFSQNPEFIANRFGFEDTTGATYEADKVVGYDPYTDVDGIEYDLPPTFWMLAQSDAGTVNLSTIERIEAHGNDVTTAIYTETDHSGVCRLNIDECWNDALAYLEAHQTSDAEHRYYAWTVTKDATCTEAGEMRRECADCDHYETMILSQLDGHAYGTGAICTACGYIRTDALSQTLTLTPGQFDNSTGEWVSSNVYGCVIGYELKKGHTISISDENYVFAIRQLIGGNYNTMVKEATADSFTATEDMTIAIRVRKPDKSAITAEELSGIVLYDTLYGMTDVAGSVHRFTVEAETIDGGTATTRAAIFLPPSYSETGTPTRLIIMTNGYHGHLTDSVWNANTADDVALMKHYMEAEYAVLVVDNTAEQTSYTPDAGCPQQVSGYFKAYEYVQGHFNVEKLFSLHARSQGNLVALRIMREHPELVKCALMTGSQLSFKQVWDMVDTAFVAQRFGFDDVTGATYEADKVIGYDPLVDADGAEYDLPPTFWMMAQSDASSITLSGIDKIIAHGNDVETKIYTATDHSGVCRLNIDECWNDALAYLEAHQTSDSEHRYCAWETTKTATCGQNGEMRRYCADCDHFETMILEAAEEHICANGIDVCIFCGEIFLTPLYTEIPVLENKLQIDTSVLEDSVYGHVKDYELKQGHTLSISSADYVFSVRQLLNGNYSTMLKVPATTDEYIAPSDMIVGAWIRRTDSSELAEGELDSIYMIDSIYGMIGVEGYVHRFTVEAETIDGGTATTRAAIFLPDSYTASGTPTPLIIMTNGGSAYLTESSWQGNTELNRNLVETYLQNGYAVLVNDNTAGRIVNNTSEMVPDLGCLQQLSGLMKSYEYVCNALNLERKFSIHARSQGTFVGIRIMREYPELVKCALITGPNVSAAHRWTVITNKDHAAMRFGFADLTGSTFEADKFVGNDIYTDMAADDYSLPPTFWMESSDDVCPNNNESIYEVVERLRELGCTAEYQKFSDLTHSETCRLASEEAAAAALAFLEEYRTDAPAEPTWEQGTIAYATGLDREDTTRLRTEGYLQLSDFGAVGVAAGYTLARFVYDADYQYLGGSDWLGSGVGFNIAALQEQYPTGVYFRVVLRRVDQAAITPEQIGDADVIFYAPGEELPQPEWEIGTIASADGLDKASNSRFRTVGYRRLEAYSGVSINSGYTMTNFVYDENYTYLGTSSWLGDGMPFTTAELQDKYPTGVYFRMVFRAIDQRNLAEEDIAASGVKFYLPGEEVPVPDLGFTVEDVGSIGSWQDGAVWDGKLFVFGASGIGAVYDLATAVKLNSITLDNKDVLKPHANSVCFGSTYYAEGDKYPLLYVNIYNNYANAEDRMEGTCCVYRVTEEDGVFSTELVQVIRIGFTEDLTLWKSKENNGDVRPYGNFVVDTDAGKLYAFVMRDANKTTRFFGFDIPALTEGVYNETYGCNVVTLESADIETQFDTEYFSYLQGCCYSSGMILYMGDFGGDAPLYVVDLESRTVRDILYLGYAGLNAEPEVICVDPASGTLYYAAADGVLRKIVPDDIHLHSYETAITAPTCTEQGYTTYTCSCGESYVGDYVDATGHSYENGICAICGGVALDKEIPDSLDDIAWENLTYRDIFITNNLIYLDNFDQNTFYPHTQHMGVTTITAAAYSTAPYSLYAGGTSSQQLVSDKSIGKDGDYFVACRSYCVRYVTGTLGLCVGPGTNNVGAREVTDGFVTCVDTLYGYSYNKVYIGSCNSADLDGYVDDVVVVNYDIFSTIPNEVQFTYLYETYLNIERSRHRHTEVRIPAVAPTYTDSGLTEGTICSECGEILAAQQPIPPAYDGSKLPEGYTLLDYLESIDGAYIDTGIAAEAEDKIILYAAALSNSNHSLFGSGTNSSSADRVQVHYSINYGNNDSGYTLRFFGEMSEVVDAPFGEMISAVLDLENCTGYINGAIVLEQPAGTLPAGYPIYLFAKNVSGQPDPTYTDDTRIYAYKHYRNGVLVRDMVPCFREADGEYGMYDLVENKFYTNAGEGSLFFDALDLTGGGGIAMNMDTGEIYYGKNIHWQHGMASTTKIMTCILALEHLELDARTVAAVKSDLIDGSVMGLVEGESLTVLDALYGLMLPSGNDAAQLLARTVAGDYDSFVAMMNDKAAELGMTSTHFTNSSGRYDHEDHYTTVYDMTKLMRYAMQNETFRMLVATKTHQIEADDLGARAHSLTNTNQLLWNYEGILGGKTGTTNGSGAHLIVAAERHGTTIVAMILGSDTENRFSDVEKLLDYGFEQAPDHVYESVINAPTCTEQGYTTYTCSCGESYVGDYVDALGHDWTFWQQIAEANCQGQGRWMRSCETCTAEQYTTDQDGSCVSFNSPAILVNSGDTVVLTYYDVALSADTVADAASIVWSSDQLIIDQGCATPSQPGVYALTATSGTVSKTVYLVVKAPGDTEYVLYFDDFNDATLSGYRPIEVSSGAQYYVSDGKLILDAGNSAQSYIRILLPEWIGDFGDYEISTTFTMTEALDSTKWFAVMARVQDEDYPYWQAAVRYYATASDGIVIDERTKASGLNNGWNITHTGAYTENISASKYYLQTFGLNGSYGCIAINGTTLLESDTMTLGPGDVGFQVRGAVASIDSIKIVIPADTSAHTLGDWTVTTVPACTEPGTEIRACSVCGYTETREVDPSHDLVQHEEKMHTCTESGWLAYETCTRCDYSTFVEVAPAGHSYQRRIHSVAHRGYSQTAPENTLASYELAKQLGYFYVECDVSFTADGIPVLLHDDTIDRTSDGTGKISELTYEQLLQYDFGSWKSADYAGTRIPTFEEFVALCAELDLHPYIELKSSGNYTQEKVQQLVDIVEAHGMTGKVTWISFSNTFLGYVKNADPTARLGYIYSGDASESVINTAKKLQTDQNEVFLLLNYSKITNTGILRAATNGFAIEVWTVNSESAILALPSYVSGVISDKLNAQSMLVDSGITVTAPTCTEQGYTTYTCSACGHSYVDDYTDALGHDYSGITCTVCGGEHPAAANYAGKVISILGDSISTFAGYIPVADGFNLEHLARYPQDNLLTDVNETWWMQVITQLDAKLGINDSWRGSTVSGYPSVTTGVAGYLAAMSNTTQIQNLGSNGTPDVILFYGGTNDLAHTPKLGTFDPDTAPTEVDLTTLKWDNLADGFVHTLLRLKHFYPDAEIVCLLPTYTASYYSDDKLAQGNALMAAICEHYGVPYVDLRDSGISVADLPDGIHPDATGMDYITNAALGTLLAECEMEAGENVVYSVTHELDGVTASLSYYKGISADKTFTETLAADNEMTVTVTMDGVDITDACYADGTITITSVTGDLMITAKAKFSLGDRLQQLPENICAGTNLWPLLEHDADYYTVDGWGVHSSGNVYSVTIPANPGDQIWATSFGKAGTNGSSINGIRLTWFGEDGVIKSLSATETYTEFTTNGYLTAPEGATAVNVVMWTNSDSNELYILNLPHDYSAGLCTVCGHDAVTVDVADGTLTITSEELEEGTLLYLAAYDEYGKFLSLTKIVWGGGEQTLTLPEGTKFKLLFVDSSWTPLRTALEV